MNSKEKQLAFVFSNVLSVSLEQLGRNSDFFQLGGNSISAIRLVQQACNVGLYFTTKDIFTRRTISLLIKYCSNQNLEIDLPDIVIRYYFE